MLLSYSRFGRYDEMKRGEESPPNSHRGGDKHGAVEMSCLCRLTDRDLANSNIMPSEKRLSLCWPKSKCEGLNLT